MGDYLNPSNIGFSYSLRSEIHVDKSEIISYTNKVLMTQQRFVCVSRPRRFGKTMAAKMLIAYYSRGCSSGNMFANLKITMVVKITDKINKEILEEYKNFDFTSVDDLSDALQALYKLSKIPIVFIIDEWDCIFREYQTDKNSQKVYLDFLRNLFKDREYIALAYMTGILPIKKYGTHSALNMFSEFSMTDPRMMSEFVGFTRNEVMSLCDKYQMDYEEMAVWYDGYRFPDIETVYNPKSVVEALLSRRFGNYWSRTETFEALSVYIRANYDGLKDIVIELLAASRKPINISNFTNDMVTFKTYDDVLTLLIHLGYLGYDIEKQEVFIPNKEIADEFVTAIRDVGWNEVIMAIRASDDLLTATWREDAQTVAQAIEQAHNETSIIKYNDENALSCIISLAYYSARQYYNIHREMPAGKGFADIVFLPRKNHIDKPAMIVELKWDKSAAGAIRQIEDRQYSEIIKDYKENALLIGINYDKDTKRHDCTIKRYGIKQ